MNKEKGVKPETHEKFVHEFPTLKVSGIAGAAVSDYIRSNQMNMSQLGSEIIIYNKSFPSKVSSLKKADRIKNYVKQKYEKLGKEFSCVFAYLVITQQLGDCCTTTSIIKSKPSAGSMIELIKKGL